MDVASTMLTLNNISYICCKCFAFCHETLLVIISNSFSSYGHHLNLWENTPLDVS